MNCYYLGQLPFDVVRRMQVNAVEQMQREAIPDLVFFCQHPATITLGKRVKLSDVSPQLNDWRQRGIEVIQTDRGGQITYHGPGQLLVYPVIQLKRHGIGVRDFVEIVLSIIATELAVPNLEIDIDQVGLWTAETAVAKRKKLASVGLRIQSGITNHGFSINLNCDTSIFEEFTVCGIPDAKVSSLRMEKGFQVCSEEDFCWQLAAKLREKFSKQEIDTRRVANT